MSRYLELYLPSGSIEITQTHRYSQKTGKSELCVIAVRPLKPGQTITDLKGKLDTIAFIGYNINQIYRFNGRPYC